MNIVSSRKIGASLAAVVTGIGLSTVTAAAAQAEPLGQDTAFVVVQQGTGTSRAVAAVKAAGGAVVQEWPQIGVVVASASDGRFDDIAREQPGIVEAGPSRNLKAYQPPAEDPAAPGEPTGLGAGTTGGDDTTEELNAGQWDMRQIKADQAHKITDGSRDVTVGVLDSGIEATHPDLAPNIDPAQSVGCNNRGIPDTSAAAWQPTNSYHGTHVAGTIGAARNDVGIVGVAPNVRLASVKVVDDDGFIYPEYAICGFVWAGEKGMEVTNSSYFVDPFYIRCNANEDERAAILAVTRAIRFSERKDVVNVAAAGNSAWDLSKEIVDENSPNNDSGPPTERTYKPRQCTKMPALTGDTVTVSSVGSSAQKSFFSNYGAGMIDVTAPGGDSRVPAPTPAGNGRVLSTLLDGEWGYLQGTSMAAPHAAGVVALIRSVQPDLTAKRAISKLKRDADRLPCPKRYDSNNDGQVDAVCEGGRSGRGFYGSGLVDALAAVQTP